MLDRDGVAAPSWKIRCFLWCFAQTCPALPLDVDENQFLAHLMNRTRPCPLGSSAPQFCDDLLFFTSFSTPSEDGFLYDTELRVFADKFGFEGSQSEWVWNQEPKMFFQASFVWQILLHAWTAKAEESSSASYAVVCCMCTVLRQSLKAMISHSKINAYCTMCRLPWDFCKLGCRSISPCAMNTVAPPCRQSLVNVRLNQCHN